jgi:L-galactono-1,4-lactone dehydrogenase
VERTSVSGLREVRRLHAQRLRENKHLRYMWIPNTDTVVVVTCNEVLPVRPLLQLLFGACVGSGVEGGGGGGGGGEVYSVSCSRCWQQPTWAEQACALLAAPQGQEPTVPPSKYSEEQRLAPLRSLLRSRLPPEAAGEVDALSATQCRDRLLALAPLDAAWVRRVNQAEAEHWRRW